MARQRFVNRQLAALTRNFLGKHMYISLTKIGFASLAVVWVSQNYQCKRNQLDAFYHHHRSSSAQWLLE
jgi:hypothetical protein